MKTTSPFLSFFGASAVVPAIGWRFVTDTVTDAGNEGMRAHVYGTTAVVTGILWTKGHSKGVPFQHRYRYTDTWLRLGGRWQCIASQDYDMPLRARG